MKKTVSFSKYLDFGTFCVTLPLYTTTFFSWFHYHAKNSAIMHFSPLWAFSTFGTAELAGAVTLRKVCYVFLGGFSVFFLANDGLPHAITGIQRSNEQLPNARLTLGINYRSFICFMK